MIFVLNCKYFIYKKIILFYLLFKWLIYVMNMIGFKLIWLSCQAYFVSCYLMWKDLN